MFVSSGAIEPYLEAYRVDQETFLPTSPEFSLKKIFPAYKNTPGIYEIAHAFRKEPLSKTHLNEFLMIEWYRAKTPYLELQDEVVTICAEMYQLNAAKMPRVESLRVSELFERAYSARPQPDWSHREYGELLAKSKVGSSFPKSRGALEAGSAAGDIALVESFSVLFDHAVTARQNNSLLFLYDFPPQVRGMAALSNEGWARRLEAFLGPIEAASGYQELSDPDELRRLWEGNNAMRKAMGQTPHPIDETLIALTPQMEGAAGMAMGLERVLMAASGIDDISKLGLGSI